MGFKKGETRPEGAGRKPGSANLVTRQMREMLRSAAEGNMDRFLEELDTLHGEKYVNAYLTMCKFVMPTLQAVKVDDANSATRSITLKLMELSAQTSKNEKKSE